MAEKIEFLGALGTKLSARCERPAGQVRAYALFAHCFTCSKDLKAVTRLSQVLTERGIAVFRFDFTGLGESEGDFADTNFSSNLEDLLAAADYMRENLKAPQILIGHSLGGTAMLAVTKHIPEVKAVATIGSPSDTQHLGDSLATQAPELKEQDETKINLGGRPFKIRRQLLDDLASHTLREQIANLGRPLLVMHSPVDETVDIDHARRIYETAKHPKSFVSLDDADHLLLRDARDASYVGEVLASWAGRYVLDAPEPSAPEAAEGEVIVEGAEGFRQLINASGHTLVADEPLSVGGTNTGPTPYGLLLASLGACTSMTMRMYADLKKIPLERVEVSLKHDKIYAADCEDCESTQSKVDEITRTISLYGNLDNQQRQKLIEIADKCPVHKTLHAEVKIRTQEAAKT